jgi:hypothetical protein
VEIEDKGLSASNSNFILHNVNESSGKVSILKNQACGFYKNCLITYYTILWRNKVNLSVRATTRVIAAKPEILSDRVECGKDLQMDTPKAKIVCNCGNINNFQKHWPYLKRANTMMWEKTKERING